MNEWETVQGDQPKDIHFLNIPEKSFVNLRLSDEMYGVTILFFVFVFFYNLQFNFRVAGSAYGVIKKLGPDVRACRLAFSARKASSSPFSLW